MDQITQPESWHQDQFLIVGEISAEQISQQLALILDSKHLRQAKSLEKFLRYTIEKKLGGTESELKEYSIGVDVFQRGSDFDPRKDAVVRVQANVLRKRLASYYEDEGLLDEIIIEMPKGHYIPQFHRRSLKTDLIIAQEETILTASPVEMDLPAQVSVSPPRYSWKTFGWVAIIFLLGVATASVWPLGKEAGAVVAEADNLSAKRAEVEAAYRPLWGKFMETGVENVLAYGTPQFFVADGVYLRDVKINSPEEIAAGSRLMSLQKASHMEFKPTEVYTGVGETHGVHLLTRFFDQSANNLRVARSRMVGWNEMKNANIIFLSSMRFHTLAKELPYPSDFAINPGVTGKVMNLRPLPGEPETYGGTNGQVHAVITVWPGKLQQRRIMILSGSDTWATLAVAEYVTDPEYLRQLNQHLEQCRKQSGRIQHPPFFQVLLRAEVKDNQPVNIAYVTHHDFDIPDAPSLPATTEAGKIAQLISLQR